MDRGGQVTALLDRWGRNDRTALPQLMELVYGELRALAASYLQHERREHTLGRTALVHEVYLRLAAKSGMTLENRSHFYGIAARTMRQILVDHWRRRHAGKRGAGWVQAPLEEAAASCREDGLDMIALDRALDRLAAFDEGKARIVEMRYFAGLAMEDIAGLTGVSPSTVKREWTVAKLWLFRELKGLGSNGPGHVA
jgi:RNA polymerase sigma factor (TIGR02999 family)